MQARLQHCLIIDESDCRAFLVQKLALGRVKLHVLITRGNNAVEATQLENLSLHVFHAAAEVQHQVIAQAIRNIHAPLESVSLGWRENDVHLLISEILLQKLLIFEAIRGACNHADVECLNQDLHRHDGVRVTTIEHQYTLYPVFVNQPG